MNALIPGAERAIGEVNEVDRPRPAHLDLGDRAAAAARTSTGLQGWVIDTPGVRSFGLSHVSRDRIIAAFDDLRGHHRDCPRGCRHDDAAPECALGRRRRERGDSSPPGWSRSAGCSVPASSVGTCPSPTPREQRPRCVRSTEA